METLIFSFELNGDIYKKIQIAIEDEGLDTIESKNFSGLIVLSVIIALLPHAIKIIKLLLEYEEVKRKGTITIGKDVISFSGFTKEEMKELLESQSVEELITRIKKKK